MATIKEISTLAGVSRGTVDRVLHSRGKVSKEAEDRVRKVIDDLGYKPNKIGKMLSSIKKPKKIGVLTQAVDNPFFSDVIRGIERASNEIKDMGFEVVLKTVKGFSDEDNIKAIEYLIKEGVDSLVLTVPDSKRINQYLDSLNTPFGALNSRLSSSKCLYYVGSDYFERGRLHAALLSMVSKERLRLVILTGSEEMRGHKEIIDGFLSGLNERNTKYELLCEYVTSDDANKTREVIEKALESYPGINAIFVSTAGAYGLNDLVINKNVLVFTSDLTDETKSMLVSNKVMWTITQEPEKQGYESVIKMEKYLTEGVTESLITNNVIVLKENL